MSIVWDSLNIDILLSINVIGADKSETIFIVIILITNINDIFSLLQDIIIEPKSILIPTVTESRGKVLTIDFQRLDLIPGEFNKSTL